MTNNQRTEFRSGFTAESTADEVLTGVDLDGKTALVTGGYSGLGLETTRALVKAGARVLVPARRPEVARARLHDLHRVTVVPMDLADLASVRTAGERLAESEARLDIAIAAAGVMASPERRVGPGWESHFAINHLGHFVLINLLLPLLSRADGARVVSYSSAGHHLSDIRWNDPHFDDGYDKWLAYGQSKTANVLFTVHLDAIAKDDGIRAFSLHPGAVITELQRDMTAAEQIERGWIDAAGDIVGAGFKSPSQGAATGLWAATSALLEGRGGVYCEDCDIAPLAGPEGSMETGGVRDYAVDPESAERLWQVSARITGVHPYERSTA
ncbi:NAD(P)-dependent dehydrogenase (short-subunit alcohol dehydrogenase family) [Actinoalloteichus hoggarensis]|uniref:Probable oxidoreductase n=1 Tax=Actinoalloteichus hoggarensis TaxID=1470176 RepID=A0A221W7W4_9PSEU|nr:oxidoreductase [Actinoalloteichus hoggarensis]ASO22062.1 2,3-dihydro-2,3-dihydroxybenzoate dehydrogenase [Actinoalloteichus hoggarensis]MBB5923856.1 NAD(P)-dependent dehydrogenase (short-subunit alcohol dehydrogenase family) [Actinoalloteichus hoggarensis]